jgi:aspartate/methionine/tyrosine aminotransferase
MRLAERMERLGTETAFAVSAEANALAAKGRKIYPFHLGDMNLPTPSPVVEGAIKALRDGKTGYCPNAGIPELREALAEDINRSHQTGYTLENISIQPGGKPIIGKFIQALMDPGDEVLYPSPGYPIYESQIDFFGGAAVPYGFQERDGAFRIDLESIERSIGPRTRLLILNDLQNPTGSCCTRQELEKLAGLVEANDLLVLCDEAYFDIRYSGEPLSLASLPGMEPRCILLYTFSKKFAMTGWRLGAAVGPQEAASAITKLNVNAESCSTHFVQHGALAGLQGPMDEVEGILETLRRRRDLAVERLNDIEGVRCNKPQGTFYLYPNVTQLMERWNLSYEGFRKRLLEETGVSVCTRLHFGRPQSGEQGRFLRLAYAGIGAEEIEEGLQALKAFLER